MTNEEIKKLEKELWGAADNLRANSKLTAAEYKDPVLDLILLRYAQNKFEEAKKQLEKDLPINPRTNQKRKLIKDDFLGVGAMYLQEKSQFDYLVNLPESQDIAEAVNNAMRLIEADYKDIEGILPKGINHFRMGETLFVGTDVYNNLHYSRKSEVLPISNQGRQ